jgi:16S rRNA G966 N2-methylase RsmD
MRKVCFRAEKNKFVHGGFLSDVNMCKFRCRYDSASAMSNADDVEKLCHLIKCSFPYKHQLHILDACAGAGGDSIQFYASGFFQSVVTVEIDKLNYSDLQHNVAVAKQHVKRQTCVTSVLDSCINVLGNHHQNIVYFDPPWSESQFQSGKMELRLNEQTIQCVLKQIVNAMPELYILKVPKNWCYFQQCEVELDWNTQLYYGRKFNWCFLWCKSCTGSLAHCKVE